MIEVEDKYLNLLMDETNCWQFIADYYKEKLGIEIEGFRGRLKGRGDKVRLANFLEKYLNNPKFWQKVDFPEYPDIAMFDINGLMIHGGIVLDEGRMLHMRVTGSLVQSYSDGTLWAQPKFKSLRGFYRYIGDRKDKQANAEGRGF